MLRDARYHEQSAHVEPARQEAVDHRDHLVARERVGVEAQEDALERVVVALALPEEHDRLDPQGFRDAAGLVAVLCDMC